MDLEHGQRSGCMDEWLDIWMDGWMDKCAGGWMWVLERRHMDGYVDQYMVEGIDI